MAKKSSDYIHGYSKKEQNRLIDQASIMEPSVYEVVDFTKEKKILEVGCGVGAQTSILLRRFPHLEIECVDLSKAQIEVAKNRLKKEVARKQVRFTLGDASELPFENDQYDAAFLCFFLEHVKSPLQILKEVRRVLKPGGRIICSEVMNSTFFLHPYSPMTLQYWFEFNDHQWNMGGDPFVGAKLGNLLLSAGFQDVKTYHKLEHFDQRMPKARASMIDYWTELLLSGAPSLIQSKKVSKQIVEGMKKELENIKNLEDSVFYYSWFQAEATAK